MPPGPDGAAQGSTLDPSPCAGASSHIQCTGREQGRGSSTVRSGLQAAGTSLPLQSVAYSSGISSCLMGAGGNVYLPVFPTLKPCLRSHWPNRNSPCLGDQRKATEMLRVRDSGRKLNDLYKAVSKGGTWEIPACACPQQESSLAWKDLEETRPSVNRPEGGGGDVTHKGLGEFQQMLIEHFLALRQSAVSNDEECLEHIWTLTPTQEKD